MRTTSRVRRRLTAAALVWSGVLLQEAGTGCELDRAAAEFTSGLLSTVATRMIEEYVSQALNVPSTSSLTSLTGLGT